MTGALRDPLPDPLVSPEAAVALADSGGATFLDVRWALGRSDGREDYLAGHVPSACFVDLETELSGPIGDGSAGRHPLPEPADFGAAMRRAGVSSDRPVVVYDDVAGTSAARAWWLLVHHGHSDVALLDGGWSAYVAAGGAVATGEELTAPGDFVADAGRLRVLDSDETARVAADGVLIDARAPERFRGEVEPIDPVAGHIPGAVNVPAATNLRDGRFAPVDEVRAMYAGVGVLSANADVAVYCGSGVTAAHDVLALRRIGVDAGLFAGSWSAWVHDPARPVATDP